MIAPMGLGLKAAIDLEQGIANINASLGGLDTGTLDQLAASFQEIGAASQFSATEVASVADSLAKAGFTTEQLLNGATQAVVDLSQATGDGLGPAVDGVIIAMNTWSETTAGVENAMTDASRVADILTTAANESSAGIGDINAGMRSLGPIAASMGIGFDESAAAIALFTNNGLKGADAGVSLARGLQNLADPTSEAATRMSELGIAAFDMEGNFVGFPSLFRQLNTSMADMSDQAQLTALSTIFGAEAMDVMGLAILNGAEPLEALIALMGESGAAAEQSALRMDTLGAQFDTLVEGVTTFLGSLVQGLIPGLRLLVDGANAVVDVLMKIPAPIKTITGALLGSLAAWAAVTRAMQAYQAFDMLLGGGGRAARRGFIPPVGPVLAFAAAAGLAFVAYRKNFGNIRKIVDRAVDGITSFIDNLRDSWDSLGDTASDAMETINRWGGIDPDVPNNFARALLAVGSALRSIGGDNTPTWLESLGRGFESAGRFIDRFKDAWDSFSQIDMSGSDLMDQINTWGQVTNELPFAERALRSFAAAVAGGTNVAPWLQSVGEAATRMADAFRDGGFVGLLDQVGREIQRLATFAAGQVVDIAIDVLVNIAQWIPGAIADLAVFVRNWAMGYTDAQGIDHPGVLVNIADWIRGTVPDLWQKIKVWAMGGVAGDGTGGPMGPGGANQEIPIGAVAVKIADWVVGAAKSLGSSISDWITNTAWPAVQNMVHDLGSIGVLISDWLVSAGKSIWQAIQDFVLGRGTAPGVGGHMARALGGQEPIDAGVIPIKVSGWDFGSVDVGEMYRRLNEHFKQETEVNISGLEASGEEAGLKAVAAIKKGLQAAWSALTSGGVGGGVGPGPGGGPTGSAGMTAGLQAMMRGLVKGIGKGLLEEIQIEIDETVAGLQGVFGRIPDAISTAMTGMQNVSDGFGNWLNEQAAGIGVKLSVFGTTVQTAWDTAMTGLDLAFDVVGEAAAAGLTAIFDGVINQINAALVTLNAFGLMIEETAAKLRIDVDIPFIDYIPTSADRARQSLNDLAAAGDETFRALSRQGVIKVDVDANTAPATMRINELGQLEPIEIPTGADTSGAQADIAMIGPPAPIKIPLELDFGSIGGAAASGAAGLAQAALGIAQNTITVTIKADDQVTPVMDTITQSVANLAVPAIALNATDNATPTISTVQSGIDGLTSVSPSITITADPSSAMASITDFVATTIGVMGAWSGGVIAIAAGAMAGVTASIVGGMAASVGAVAGGVAAMVGAMRGGIAAMVGAISGGMAAATGAVAANAARWPGIIAAVGGSMAGAGRAVGAAAGMGVASGLLSTLGAVTAAANAIVARVNSAMTAAARIASPSRMTEEIGDYMGRGLADGLWSQAGVVTNAAVSVVQNAIAAAKSAAGIASPAKEMVPVGVFMDDGLAQGILAGQSTVIAAAIQVAQAAINAARRTMGSARPVITESKGWQWLSGSQARLPDGSIVSALNTYVGEWQQLTRGYWRNIKDDLVGVVHESNMAPGFFNEGYAAGQALGSGVAAGTRNALQIRSPSRVLAQMGKYSAQGFIQGFDRTYDAPSVGFKTAPYVGGGYSAGGGAVTYAPVITITVDATGKDVDENRIAVLAAEGVTTALENVIRRNERAMGGR
jgi:TP901 family phage tail tape measure protein